MITIRRKGSTAILSIAGLIVFGQFALSHPTVEGGMKTAFVAVKGFAGTHLEFVADREANELRIYVSEAEDGKTPEGKKWEWVINMAVRTAEITTAEGKKEQVSLAPFRDPGRDKEWFPVAPVERKDGYVFYRAEVTGRVMLDGDPAKRHSVIFKAGRGPHGRRCFKAAVNLADAKDLRLEEVRFSVLDAAGKKEPWTKICFQQAYGLGLIVMKKQNQVAQVDLPISVYTDALAKISEAGKFRKPEAPVL